MEDERDSGYRTEVRIMVENYYDVQQLREMAFNRIVDYLKYQKQLLNTELTFEDDLTRLKVNEILKTAAKIKEQDKGEKVKRVPKEYSQIATLICSGKAELPRINNLVDYFNQLYSTEKAQGKALKDYGSELQIKQELLEVSGVGDIIASGIIAWLSPIDRFDKVSNLWSYAGLAPNSKREVGKKINYNPKLKTFCWKIWQQWVKLPDSYGRKLYDEGKEICLKSHPDWTKGHIHNWAGHRAVKIFLAAIWDRWREIEGLPITQPYAFDILHHADKITLKHWRTFDGR